MQSSVGIACMHAVTAFMESIIKDPQSVQNGAQRTLGMHMFVTLTCLYRLMLRQRSMHSSLGTAVSGCMH